jgi:6,7-dimethyl-8-ribityllumazine synthase
VIEGGLSGKGRRFAIVASRFNESLTERLLDGALDALRWAGVRDDDVTIAWVPGAFEIPAAARRLAESRRFDGIIGLGAVIRGETPHFEYVAHECAAGIARIGLETGVPVSFGVLTTDSIEQAMDRAGGKSGNKGAEAAHCALEMANVLGALARG